jgi:hypothetical protein
VNDLKRFLARNRLPAEVWTAVGLLLLFVPAQQYLSTEIRHNVMSGSVAEALTRSFFWGVLWLRVSLAVLGGLLLLAIRNPAAPAIVLTSMWLVGPPLTALQMGIEAIAASMGQQSWSWGAQQALVTSFVLPTFLSICLLATRRARAAYAAFSG